MKPTPTPDLLPCPFCCEPLERSETFSTRTTDCMIHPDNDCIMVGTRVLLSGHPDDVSRADRWNRRAALSVPAAAVVGEPVAYYEEDDGEKILYWPHTNGVFEHIRDYPSAHADRPRPLYAAPSAPDGWQPDVGQQWFLDRIREEITAGRTQNALTYLSCAFAEAEKKFETADKLRVFWNDKVTVLAGKLDEARKAAFIEAAEIAEGPPYKEHYRGDENGNWTSYSDYGRGRFAAAAAIRARAEETGHE